jgi:hypothetical protein
MANTDNANGFRFAYSEAGHVENESGTLESGQTAYKGDILVMDFTSGKLNVGTATSPSVWGVAIGDCDASSADTEILYVPAVPWAVFDVQCSGTYAITMRGHMFDVETAGSGTFEVNEDSYSNPLVEILDHDPESEIGANSRVYVKFVKSQYLECRVDAIPDGASTSAITTDSTLTSDDSGLYLMVTSDATITLPATDVGVHYNIVNAAPANTITLAVSPNASDRIMGADFSDVADDKDIQNTKATSKQGDRVKLQADGSDGWFITELVGTWTTEA